MKKLIYLLPLLLLLSCEEPTRENSIQNPKHFTTIEKQEMQRDTIIVSYSETNMYVWNDGLITEQYKLTNGDSVVVSSGIIIICAFLILIIGIAAGSTNGL